MISQMGGPERRRNARRTHYCEAEIEGLDFGRSPCRIADISIGGVFVEARTVLPVGTRAHVRFRLAVRELSISSDVRYSQPGSGMGIRFLELSQLDEVTIRTCMLGEAGRGRPINQR